VPAIRYLAIGLFILCIPVALVTSTIRYVVNEPRVYRYAIDEYGAVEATGISRSELLRGSAELREYFNNDQALIDVRVQENGREVPLFNQRETIHLRDVKDRFEALNRFHEFSLLYGVVFVASVVLWAREIDLRGLAQCIAAGCAISIGVIAIIGAIGLAGFEGAWEDFHKLIFSNDFWLLNTRTDHLIQMFPPAFWESIVFFIGLMVVAEAALILLAAAVYLGVTKHRQAEPTLTPYYA
jgi:integral membrane protein (TIGR01906 family)